MKIQSVILWLACASMLASFAQPVQAQPRRLVNVAPDPALIRNWYLVRMNGKPAAIYWGSYTDSHKESDVPTIAFSTTVVVTGGGGLIPGFIVEGRMGLNGYVGTYTIPNTNTIQFGFMSPTLVACHPSLYGCTTEDTYQSIVGVPNGNAISYTLVGTGSNSILFLSNITGTMEFAVNPPQWPKAYLPVSAKGK